MPSSFDYASLLSERYPEVSYKEFYRDLFPPLSLQEGRVPVKGEYPAIAVMVRPSGNLRITVTDDLSAIDEIVSMADPGDFCIMSPVSYAGMTQRKSMAHALYALVFDLDGLKVKDGEPRGFNQLLYQFKDILGTPAADFALPVPTYIAASGNGLHLYYMLKKPVLLWPETLDAIEVYRTALTNKMWNRYITDLWEKPQHEGATQCFRMVGTPVKPSAGTGVVRAFLTGEKVTPAYMDRFVDPSAAMGTFPDKRGSTPFDKAIELWPEWYETRIVDGVPRMAWRNKRDLYDWWKRRVLESGSPGHRYNCIVALAAYAVKCGIDRDELERDAEELRVVLDSRDPGNPFTRKDVRDALTAHRSGMVRYPIDTIAKRTGIPIKRNKRNGRKQSLHLKMARSNLAILSEDAGHGIQGRKPKRDLIRSYAAEHPEASQREIARALGVSKTTVNKWLKTES